MELRCAGLERVGVFGGSILWEEGSGTTRDGDGVGERRIQRERGSRTKKKVKKEQTARTKQRLKRSSNFPLLIHYSIPLF